MGGWSEGDVSGGEVDRPSIYSTSHEVIIVDRQSKAV